MADANLLADWRIPNWGLALDAAHQPPWWFKPVEPYVESLAPYFENVFRGAIILGVVVLILKLFRMSQRSVRISVEAAVTEIAAITLTQARTCVVEVKFTVYTMFLLWGQQQQIVHRLPYQHSLMFLKKMLVHNLTKGWFGPAGVFVPFLTVAEYYTQGRSIDRQYRLWERRRAECLEP